MKKCYADVAGVKIGDHYPVRVIGIINLSPESFYKGSVASSESALLDLAAAMVNEGADIIDVGAMSTAPYKEAQITESEEIARIRRAMKPLREAVKVPISVDTIRSKVAQEALKLGADMVNDVTGFNHDPQMAKVASDSGAAVLLMANEKSVQKGAPIKRVGLALKNSLDIAVRHGIKEDKVIVDPGIGFFREKGNGPAFSVMKEYPWYVWDSMVLNRLEDLRSLAKPIAIGVSRKSFIGRIGMNGKENGPEERLPGSLAAAASCVLNGAHMVRVHDVAATVQAVRLAEAIAHPERLS